MNVNMRTVQDVSIGAKTLMDHTTAPVLMDSFSTQQITIHA